MPLIVEDCRFWGWLPVDPDTYVIVVGASVCFDPPRVGEIRTNCPGLSVRMIVVDVAKYLQVNVSPALKEFSIGATQTVSGAISWTDDAPWPWGAEIASVTLTVGGVSVPVTWTTNGNSLSFSAEFPTPCEAVPVALHICWAGGYCQDIPLGLKEGYEIVRRQTWRSHGAFYANVSGNPCPSGESRYGEVQSWEASWFDMPCNGNTTNAIRETGEFGYEACLRQIPPQKPRDRPWGPTTRTVEYVAYPDRGFALDDSRLQWSGADSFYDGFYLEEGSIRFRAPRKYGKDTTVLFTLEGVYCSTNLNLVKLWGHAPLEADDGTWWAGGTLTYLVTVDGGKEYTIDKDSFEWPATFQSWEGGSLYEHRLSFTGFHNQDVKASLSIYVRQPYPGTRQIVNLIERNAGHTSWQLSLSVRSNCRNSPGWPLRICE